MGRAPSVSGHRCERQLVNLEEGKDARKVIEDVVVGTRLEDRQSREHSPATRDDLGKRELVDITSRRACDEIDDEEQTEKQGHSFCQNGGHALNPAQVQENRNEDHQDVTEERRVEAERPQLDPRIDEERADPHEQNEREHNAIRLEPEGQA